METERNEYTYPKGERVWVGYYTDRHQLKFIMTSKNVRDYYYLYELIDNKFKKLGKARSPKELEEKFEVNERLQRTS